MMIMVSPLLTVKLTPLRTVRFPNLRTRSRTSMTGSSSILVQDQTFSGDCLSRLGQPVKRVSYGKDTMRLVAGGLSRHGIRNNLGASV